MNRTERDALGRIGVRLPAIPGDADIAALELVDVTGHAIAEMVRRLEAPTAAEVVELATSDAESGDVAALLCLAGFESWIWVDNDAGMPRWRALHARGALDLRWAIEAAFFAEITSGARRPARALVEMVDELDLAGRAREVLDACGERGPARMTRWARERLPYWL